MLYTALLTLAFAAADEPKLPQVGKPAPDAEVAATSIGTVLPDKKDAKKISLSDFKGKKNVVLFFYPRALTRGCTIESCGFRDRVKKFADLDTVIIGISTDPLDLQGKFTEKEKLNFPLIADTDKTLTKAYGALGPKGNAVRYTFVIDKKGNLRKVYTRVDPKAHPDEVLKFVKDNLAGGK